MPLSTAIDFFTNQTHSLASMAIAVGTAEAAETALGGCKTPAGEAVAEDTLYDLASLTKLMTGLLVMRLHEEGLLDLSAPITRYAPQLKNLQSVTVDQALGFEIGLVTPERVDAQPSAEEARRVLEQIAPQPNGDGRAYSDMHAMVLKLVLEGAAGERYMPLLQSRILTPLGMADTCCRVPESQRHRCAVFDGEHRLERGRYVTRWGIAPGTPHDPKARVLNLDGDDCCGHAGLFSTLGDMARLCQGVLRERVVSRASLRRMAQNRTGRALPGGGYTQYLGSLCYVKHPVQYFSEIPVYESDEAIGISGFTGHHLSIDPKNGVFVLYLGNRVMNRLTVFVPSPGQTLADIGLTMEGVGQVNWPDGTRIWSSVNYVHLKDEHFHREAEAALHALR